MMVIEQTQGIKKNKDEGWVSSYHPTLRISQKLKKLQRLLSMFLQPVWTLAVLTFFSCLLSFLPSLAASSSLLACSCTYIWGLFLCGGAKKKMT
jgi:hypothetical protein